MNNTCSLSSRTQRLAAFSASLAITLTVVTSLLQLAGSYQVEERLAAAQPAKAASQQVVVAGQRANGG